MSPISGRPGGRHAGKRFSVARLAASVVVAAVVMGGGVAAASVPFFAPAEAATASVPSVAARPRTRA